MTDVQTLGAVMIAASALWLAAWAGGRKVVFRCRHGRAVSAYCHTCYVEHQATELEKAQ